MSPKKTGRERWPQHRRLSASKRSRRPSRRTHSSRPAPGTSRLAVISSPSLSGMFLLQRVLLAVAIVGVAANICPMENHQVCNPDHAEHKCVCAMTLQESSAPEPSCNKLIVREEDGSFPVVSVKFNLDDSSEGLEEWPEESFVEAIANSLRVNDEDVLVLRASCEGTEDSLVVQFGILKQNVSLPYDEDDFIDAESIATRMKAMGHLSQIADLDVDTIEFTEELTEIEFEPDNSDLIMKAAISGVAFLGMFLLGIYASCRNRGYSDDLQKA